MEYTDNGKAKNIDTQQLKLNLEAYCKSIKDLSAMVNNSNIVGSYSEILVCSVLGLDKEPDSNKDFDAKAPDGKTYQIKSRWKKSFLDDKKGQDEFGSFKYNKDTYPFDFLILVYYEEDLFKPKVFKMKSSDINSLFKSVARKKGDRVIFRYDVSFIKAVEQTSYICDISNQFKNIFA